MPSPTPTKRCLRRLVGVVALSVALVGSAHAQPEAVKLKPKPKVLVLGAGMSGVMVANTLFEKGFTDVTILEANNYIGGRMRAGTVGGRKVELGANWIHGVGGNPIYDLATSKELNLVESNWSAVAYLPLGADPNEEQEIEEFEAAFEKTEERAKRYRDRGKKDLTVSDALRYEGWVPHTPLEQVLIYNGMDLDMGAADKTSFEQTLNIATYAKDDRDMLVVDTKGYGSLAYDLLAKSFPNPLNNNKIVLNTKVTKIEYSTKGVSVQATTNGSTVNYAADFVVTTFSAGVLRNKARELFVPSLPEDKLDAIYRVDMTLYLKVFVEATEKFWAETTQGADTWVFADQVKGNFSFWMDLSLPKLGASFASPKNGSYLVMCDIGGAFAEKMQKLSDAQLKDEVIKAMRAMFPTAASRINDKTIASVTMQRWGQDELFGGSWSNPLRDFSKADFAKLAEPVGRVYFSGEHTSAEYFGYVHGAYRAGIATAKQLMRRPEF